MGDRAAKSRARGASPAAQPSSSHLGCGARAHPLGTTRIPTGDEARVGRLGLLDPSALLIAMALDHCTRGPRLFAATRGLIPRFPAPDRAAFLACNAGPGPHVAFRLCSAKCQMSGSPRAYGRSRQRRHADRGGRGLAGRTPATDPALALPPKPPSTSSCRAHAHGPAS